MPEEVVEESVRKIAETVAPREETFKADMGGNIVIKGYLAGDLSINDPYVVVESTTSNEVLVIVNTSHPHWSQLKGSEGVLNYLRHCAYDAIAEWQARRKVGRFDPETIKMLKDRLLRVPLQIEMSAGDAAVDDLGASA